MDVRLSHAEGDDRLGTALESDISMWAEDLSQDLDLDGLNDEWENAAVQATAPSVIFTNVEKLPLYDAKVLTRVTPIQGGEQEDYKKYIVFANAIAMTEDYGTSKGLGDHPGDVEEFQTIWEIDDESNNLILKKVVTRGHVSRDWWINRPFPEGDIVFNRDHGTFIAGPNELDEFPVEFSSDGSIKIYIEENKHGTWSSRVLHQSIDTPYAISTEDNERVERPVTFNVGEPWLYPIPFKNEINDLFPINSDNGSVERVWDDPDDLFCGGLKCEKPSTGKTRWGFLGTVIGSILGGPAGEVILGAAGYDQGGKIAGFSPDPIEDKLTDKFLSERLVDKDGSKVFTEITKSGAAFSLVGNRLQENPFYLVIDRLKALDWGGGLEGSDESVRAEFYANINIWPKNEEPKDEKEERAVGAIKRRTSQKNEIGENGGEEVIKNNPGIDPNAEDPKDWIFSYPSEKGGDITKPVIYVSISLKGEESAATDKTADISPLLNYENTGGRRLRFNYYRAGSPETGNTTPFLILVDDQGKEVPDPNGKLRHFPIEGSNGQFYFNGNDDPDGSPGDDKAGIWFTIQLPEPATSISEGSVKLNLGTSPQILDGKVLSESIYVKHSGINDGSEDIEITFLGNTQRYKLSNNLLGFAGEGDDEIIIDGMREAAYVTGNSGNDIIQIINSPDGVTADSSLFGDQGDDNVQAGAGNDLACGGQGNDTVRGGTGNDFVCGDDGADEVYGEDGDDTVDGGDGNDSAHGGLGDDAVSGGSGNDNVYGGSGEDVLLGDSSFINSDELAISSESDGGNDFLDGGDGDDLLLGEWGDDIGYGGEGNDEIYGGSGDDIHDGGAGEDKMVGGAGDDIYVVDNANDVVTENENEGNDTVRTSVSLTLPKNVENFEIYGDGNIEITGNTDDNIFRGNSGNNTFNGIAGENVFYGSAGSDIFNGGVDRDTVKYEDATEEVGVNLTTGRGHKGIAKGDTYHSIENVWGSTYDDGITGDNQNNQLRGLAGDDNLDGRDGDDELDGGAGDDYLDGGEGNDCFKGGEGDDWIEGGDGIDKVTYEDSSAGIIVNLLDEDFSADVSGDSSISPVFTVLASSAQDGYGTTDFLFEVEKVIGSDHNDIFVGSLADETLDGGNGDDFFVINGGSNTVDGGDGVDTVDYRSSVTSVTIDLAKQTANNKGVNDTLKSIENAIGSRFDDTILGEDGGHILDGDAGNDTLAGGLGDDEIFGGDGDDLIRGDLNRRDTQDEISGGNDILHGGKGNDRIGGKTGDDQLYGDEGNDELWGGLGNDLLVGGQGEDILTGLTGADTFRFNSFDEGSDTVTDFDQLQGDKLEILGTGFADDLVKGVLSADAFVLGSSAINADDRFVYDQSTGSLFFDADGSGTRAAVKIADLSNNANLTHGDILVI
ncbi:MAG: calcium-binding protein [Cyanobacteria bacterium P01_B01_bin.77]